MSDQRERVLAVRMLIVGVIALWIGGCASTPPANVKSPLCAAPKIAWDVAPEAQIADFDCQVGRHGSDPALIFTMELKNTGMVPKRFRVNIFLNDMHKAAGHLVPRKGKPPVLAPGAAKTVKIPFIKTSTQSTDILVLVKTMSD